MSRERPTPMPRAVPDAQRGVKSPIEQRKERQHQELEQLRDFSGSGFIGYLAATFSRGKLTRAPQFIRRGYEASIIDELRDFFTRPRPWRRNTCRSGKTTKEYTKVLRRMEQAGQIRRMGGGRWERVKLGRIEHLGTFVGVGADRRRIA